MNAILASYSEVYILVLGIYYKLQTFLYLPANGIIQGMRPLVGYNYGAGEHKRVSQIYNIVLCMSGIIMIAGTAICLIIPGQLISLFTQNQDVYKRQITTFSKKITIFSYFIYNNEIKYYNIINVIGINI